MDEILQRVEEIPPALRDTIVDAAEGNPFYTEELVKMFIDQGVIVRSVTDEIDRWRVQADKLATVNVPSTLIALLQARIDGLPQLERELLQRAAVVGRLFWDGVVAELAQTEQTAIQPVLEAMRGRELIFQREHSAFAGSDEFVFKHNLLRDVAYERVLLKWRQDFHGRVARWLEAHAGERLSEYLNLIAKHFQLAGEDDMAAAYFLRAGREAYKANAYAAARHALERVLTLQEEGAEDNETSIEAAILLGRVYETQGDLDHAIEILGRGLAGARRLGDGRLLAEALLVRALVSDSRGEYDDVDKFVEEALPFAQTIGEAILGEALLIKAKNGWRSGDLAMAEAQAQEALALARTAVDTNLESKAMNTLANVAGLANDLEEARRRHEQNLAFARTTGNLAHESTALLNLGAVAYYMDDFLTSRAYALSAMKIARELGEALSETLLFINLAQSELHLGNVVAARKSMLSGLRMAYDKDALPLVVSSIVVAGEILAVEGERDRALGLIMFSVNHPSTEYLVHYEVENILKGLEVGEDELAAARAAAAELELEAVIAEILAETGDTNGQGR